MKRLLVALTILLGVAMSASAETPANKDGNIGVGAFISGGVKNGISAKYWIDAENAIDLAFSYAGGDYEYTYLHADYLIHRYDKVKVEQGEVPLYAGIGVFMEDDGIFATNGLRIPVGFSYMAKDAPADLYVEIAPTFVSGDVSGFYFAGSVGFRYFFETK